MNTKPIFYEYEYYRLAALIGDVILNKSDVILEKPKVFHFNSRMRWDRFVSETGEHILQYLLKNKDSNIYSISKHLNKRYSTIFKAIKEQLQEPVEFIEVSGERPHKKNRKQTIELYSLTRRGFAALVNPFYVEYSGNNEERIKALTRIFSAVKDHYPLFLPKLFMELPVEYCVSFYPSFVEDLTSPFLELLKAKSREVERTVFLIDNKYFKCAMPLTEKEEKLILGYIEDRIQETGECLKQSLAEFEKKKRLLEKIKRRLRLYQ